MWVINCECADVEYRVEPREIKARLDAPMVQAVMKMGYSRDVIRKVLERRLVTTGKRQPAFDGTAVDLQCNNSFQQLLTIMY